MILPKLLAKLMQAGQPAIRQVWQSAVLDLWFWRF